MNKPTAAKTQKSELSKDELLEFYRQMIEIRSFEETVHEAFQRGLVFGSTHLMNGQEAVSVGAVAALREDDTLTYTYRGHSQVLARGMDLAAAFGEIFGRKTGCSRGLGGSMHLADPALGLLGSFAIVGAGLPVSVGAALAADLDGTGQVSMTFFGDGSTNIGTFHESMNLAAVWKLPVIFVCENNLYGEYSPILSTTPFEDLARRADAYAMPAEIVDGNDVAAVHQAAKRAVERGRSGGGPTFLECKTYRTCGHSRSDPGKYRPEGELDAWKERDPIEACGKLLMKQYQVSEETLSQLASAARSKIEDALQVAEAAPWPEAEGLMAATYAQQVQE